MAVFFGDLNVKVTAVKLAVVLCVFLLLRFCLPQDICQCIAEIHRAGFIPLCRADFKLVPVAVVAETAPYREILLVKVDVAPRQTADLADSQARVVCYLYREQSGILFRFQILRQFQILLMSNRRRCRFVHVREQLYDIFLLPPDNVLHWIERNQFFRKNRKPKCSLQDCREQPYVALAQSLCRCAVGILAAEAEQIHIRLQMVGCHCFQFSLCYRVLFDSCYRTHIRHHRTVAQIAGL